jgi:hypothetical protein
MWRPEMTLRISGSVYAPFIPTFSPHSGEKDEVNPP